jgi:hypothetical protein
MNRALIILGLIIVLGIGTYFVVEHINKRDRIFLDGVRMEEYREESRYGYSFLFPAEYDVLEFGFENISIGTRTEEGIDALAEVVVITAASTTDYTNFEDFVYGEARIACGTDTATEVVTCGDIEQVQPFSTGSGLSGTIFYISESRRTTATGATTEGGKGPFIAFNISASVPRYEYTALIVQPPFTLPLESVNSELLRQIADTVKLIPVEVSE